MNVLMLLLAITTLSAADEPLATAPFEAPKYGVKAQIPKVWPVALREKEDRVFVAVIPQVDPDRPGVVACELGLAPENLDEYRTRIDGNARRGGRPGASLARNEVVKDPKQLRDRLETVWEFRPRTGVLWREVEVRVVANRQMYTFTLNVDDATYPAAKTAFDALVASAELSPPNTGADLLAKKENRWVQREFKFALDLPEGWSPVLAPSEVALFFANGPAHGIWSDNVLVLAQPHRRLDLEELARTMPDELRQVEPNCEVLSCKVIKQGEQDALETVVRTKRGPFSMTVLERRFRGGRYDYEVKYTVESKRFDELAPSLRKSLDSFGEVPGDVPAAGAKKAARGGRLGSHHASSGPLSPGATPMDANSIIDDVCRRLVAMADDPPYVFLNTTRKDAEAYQQRLKTFLGFTEKEITQAEQRLGFVFPKVYRAYLARLGKARGDLFCGSEVAGISEIDGLDDFEEFRANTRELLAESGAEDSLPEKAVVFLFHQGYAFAYLIASDTFDSPAYH